MPYKVKGKCVYKKNSGKKVGCTKGSTKKYLAALHANANESTDIGTFKQFCEDRVPLENKLKPGDSVKNTNPECKHYKSKGKVTKVEDIPEVSDGKGGKNTPGKLVHYTDEKTGKKLKKTGSQLKEDPISEWVHIEEKRRKKKKKPKKKSRKKKKITGLSYGRTFGFPGWFGGYYGGEGGFSSGGDGGGGGE